MEPAKLEFRSYSCPASLDLKTYSQTLTKLAEVIGENPGGFLVPTLPPFHAEVVGKSVKLDEKEKACLALQKAFKNVPFFQKLAAIPGLFAGQFDSCEAKIKHLAIGVLSGDAQTPPIVLEVVKQQIKRAQEGEENIWSEIVDCFIDELEEGRACKGKDLKEVSNPISCYLATSFLKLKALITSDWKIISGQVDKAFENYAKGRVFAKPLVISNVTRFISVVVEKSGGGKGLKKERGVYVNMIYDLVDQFLLDSQHMMFYRVCITDLINKIHGEDVPRDELKEKYLKGLWCVIDDVHNSRKMMSGAGVGITKVSDILT